MSLTVAVFLASCEPVLSQELNSTSISVHVDNTRCPPWFFYNSTLGQCQCFESRNVDVRCTDKGALLRFGRLMTYEENSGTTSVSYSSLFVINSFVDNVTQGLFIRLPSNVSELNDYMCQPLNRKGYQCNECSEGFGPSMTSIGYQCSKCMWYGVPLYLFLEYVPVTMFYLVILLLRLNVTTAPLTSYIIVSQLNFYFFVFSTENQSVYLTILPNEAYFTVLNVIFGFSGIWNLDFFRYTLPPFCVSPNLNLVLTLFLSYVSAFYPIFLIIVTWILIELRSRGVKPVVWMWKTLSQCFCGANLNWDKKSTIIDVFATFLVLSYSKLLLQSLVIIAPNVIHELSATGYHSEISRSIDVSVDYFGAKHIPLAITAIFVLVVFIVLPALLLALYPLKLFRTLLGKCRLLGHHRAAFHLFVEKFYTCYRDGLKGGNDMRSFASLYFFLRFIFLFFHPSVLEFFGLSGPDVGEAEVLSVFLRIVTIASVAVLIATVRPYKEAYMNTLDTLILATMALFYSLLLVYRFTLSSVDSRVGRFMVNSSIFVLCLPQLGFVIYLVVRFCLSKWPMKWLKDGMVVFRKRHQPSTTKRAIAQ